MGLEIGVKNMEKITKDNYLELLSKEQPDIELLDDYVNANTPMRFIRRVHLDMRLNV